MATQHSGFTFFSLHQTGGKRLWSNSTTLTTGSTTRRVRWWSQSRFQLGNKQKQSGSRLLFLHLTHGTKSNVMLKNLLLCSYHSRCYLLSLKLCLHELRYDWLKKWPRARDGRKWVCTCEGKQETRQQGAAENGIQLFKMKSIRRRRTKSGWPWCSSGDWWAQWKKNKKQTRSKPTLPTASLQLCGLISQSH